MSSKLNSNNVDALLALSLPDPTDFTNSFLRAFDSSIFCPICANYFDGPVSLACGHSFCSMCIRSSLHTSKDCPTCRSAATESQLRPNPALEEVVTAWKAARSSVLDLARQDQEHTAEPAKKKRRLSPCVAGPSRTPSADKKSDPSIPSSDTPDVNAPPPDAIVECPLCHREVKYKILNRHMDNDCSSAGSDKPTTSSSKSQGAMWNDLMRKPKSTGKGKERAAPNEADCLPKVSYDTLKDKQLRDMLSEHGLPTTGTHAILADRHRQWRMLWNARLDKSASKRQTLGELRKELAKWEEDRKVKKKKTTVGESHLKTHNEEFKKLVAAARPKDKGATLNTDAAGAASSPPTSSAVQGLPSDQDIIVVDSDDEKEDVDGI
ncbi:hypothetical protein C8R43DRAFT_983682 [Mycena crocata]|nr:hypothetical protein C8R43DRAFT_983682 [Mycena crocata]